MVDELIWFSYIDGVDSLVLNAIKELLSGNLTGMIQLKTCFLPSLNTFNEYKSV